MGNAIILSICITTYNRAEYLRRCLESLRVQIADSELNEIVEIIISDNCSTDQTATILQEYKKYFKNYKYFINEKNIGFDLNVVNVVEKSSAKFCWYLGDDDVIINGGISFVVDLLNRYNPLVISVKIKAINELKPDYLVPASIPLISAKTSIVGEEFYWGGYCLGIFSIFIFNREQWLHTINRSEFMEHWLYFEVILKMLPKFNSNCIYVDFTLVYAGQDCRWVEGGNDLYIFLNWNQLVAKLKGFGYNAYRVNQELKKVSVGLPLYLLRAKGHNLKFMWKDLVSIYSIFRYKGYLFLFLPTLIFFLPNFLVKFIKSLKKNIFKK